ncbi:MULTISPECIES: hypothetical protein [Pseudarthrobacter]|uniref:Uncharacterized protein n=1 Tax=Pseudarthrobacter niigatensis TaxID=369935 RepID=A0AAJ1T0W1_9MICC|nr:MULTISPECIES: hypothetical protein [Pseudarthrobacter]MDQ0147362.1 hypothetical protein [Pseudarthrobacter niigatensis]MDQ0267179.1 hypothetical protein [Pseudarthrobacter niigatensis]
MEIASAGSASPMKSLLYWRKSMINGAKTVPAIVAMDSAGTFSMHDAAGVPVFSVPASQAAVRFTSMGTMVVTANGRKYDVTGVGASLSPSPSSWQLAEMAAGADGRTDPTGLSRAGSAGAAMSGAGGLGAVAGAAGGAAMMFAYYQGLDAIKAWQEALPSAGATVQKSSMKAGLYISLGVVAAVVIGLVVALGLR